MVEKDDTKLEIFGFGEETDDTFYCLVDLTKSPDGIDLEQLKLADPRNFDEELDKMGCIVMVTGQEMEELIERGDINDANLHKSLYDLAVEEGIIE